MNVKKHPGWDVGLLRSAYVSGIFLFVFIFTIVIISSWLQCGGPGIAYNTHMQTHMQVSQKAEFHFRRGSDSLAFNKHFFTSS